METSELETLVKEIVRRAKELKDRHTEERSAPVNYACVFCHSEEEYDDLVEAANRIGKVVDNTPTGPLFHIKPIDTVAGSLKLLKVRMPDETRPERGDADFTVQDYKAFKASSLPKPGFKLIERKGMEMIELSVDGFGVRAYFSNPPLDKQLGLVIMNSAGERLDFIVEGDADATTTIIFVHGFGTNKDEGGNLFVDLAGALAARYRIIRFDLSGYGKSEGLQEDVNLEKQADDVRAVIDYARKNYRGAICILAFSFGCFAVSLLAPLGITKTIFVSPPNPGFDSLERRIMSRPGGTVNKSGISVYPRSSGTIQKIGPSFWKSIGDFNLLESVGEYSKKTSLMILRPMQDEVVNNDTAPRYGDVTTLKYVELNGDHDFTKAEDREKLARGVALFFS
jgi:pimeloyl-ACP methyl ester carboxylesterase